MITSIGFGLSAAAWTAVLLVLTLRQPAREIGLTGLALVVGLLCQIGWSLLLTGQHPVGGNPVAITIAESLRPTMIAVFMLLMLQASLPQASLRLATGIPISLGLASAALSLLDLDRSLAHGFSLISAVVVLLCVEQIYRNARPEARWMLKFLCLGLAVIFAFDIALRADALLNERIDPTLAAARGYVNALAAPLVILGVTRMAPARFRLSLSREVALHTATLIVTGLFLLAMAVVAYGFRLIGSAWGSVLQWVLLFSAAAGFMALLSSGRLRADARVALAKHFFSHRYDYRREWFELTRMLSSADNPIGGRARSSPAPSAPGALTDRCLAALCRMVDSPGGRLWMLDLEGNWRVRAALNLPAAQDIDGKAPVARFLIAEDWIHDIDAWRDDRIPAGCPALPEWLGRDRQTWILMPLRVQSETVALIQLQKPRHPIPVDWEVRDLLRAAGQQVAGMLRVEQTVEALIEARQFESFNRMSAFVVHDLKNLVSQLALMLKNAERHRDDPRFQDDMLDTVSNVLDRMQSMLLQLRSGVTPIEAAGVIDLDGCLRKVVEGRRWPAPGALLDLDQGAGEIASNPVKVLAHADRLERVIGHLIQNALEASEGRAGVRVHRSVRQGEAMVQVIDQGRGMSEEFIEQQLFRPFRSTKAHGMGIGAFESREYLREIGARLDVSSAPDVGSTFTIHLPLQVTP